MPAGMLATGNAPESEVVPRRAVAYTKRQVPMLIQRAPENDASGLLPPLPPLREPMGTAVSSGTWRSATNDLDYRGTAAGGGYTTVGDLLKFSIALLDNRLLNAQYTDLLITGKVDTQRPGLRYAYGFEDDRADPAVRRIGHDGGASG